MRLARGLSGRMRGMQHLDHYGWNDWFAAKLSSLEKQVEHDAVARVVQEHKEAYLVQTVAGKLWAEISGKMRHESAVRADFPAVGDWVFLRGMQHIAETRAAEGARARGQAEGPNGGRGPVQITAILPRRTTLTRRLDVDAGGDDQILATNVDIAFLGTSLNENFNLRRLERYIALARDAGARPVVLLTKVDLCADAQPYMELVRGALGAETDIHAISVVTGAGLDAVRTYLRPGTTAVILGSSGIGKSTLVNHLAEADIMDMMDTRDFDDKGRHCTTFRHLVRTPTGGLIIDTPGLRGLSLGEATDALMNTFTDVEALAANCKFSDCGHDSEPGCAIKAALEAGTLDAGRLKSYLKLQREVAAMSRRENRVADRKQKKLSKRVSAAVDAKEKFKWHGRS